MNGAGPGVRYAFAGCSAALIVMAGHALSVPRAIAIGASALGALACLAGITASSVRPPMDRRERALLGALAVPILVGVLFTLAQPVNDWDAVVIWLAKARAIADWTPLAKMPFPEYPELGPAAWSLVLPLTGAVEPLSRLVFLAFYTAWMTSLRELLPRPLPRAAIWIVPAAVVTLFDAKFITSGYQDPLVAAVGGLAFILLARHLATRGRADAMLGLFFAGILGAIKVEGLVLGALLTGSWIAILLRRPGGAGGLGSLRGALAIYIALAAFWPLTAMLHAVPITEAQDGAFAHAGVSDLVAGLSRLPLIAAGFWRVGPMLLLPLAATASLGIAAAKSAPDLRDRLAFAGTVITLHLLWIVAVFMLTTHDLEWQMRTALDRLLFQQAPVWTAVMVLSATALLDPGGSRDRAA